MNLVKAEMLLPISIEIKKYTKYNIYCRNHLEITLLGLNIVSRNG